MDKFQTEEEWSEEAKKFSDKIQEVSHKIISKVDVFSIEERRKCEERERQLKDEVRKKKSELDLEVQQHRAKLRALKNAISDFNQELKRVFEPYKKTRSTFYNSSEVAFLKDEKKKIEGERSAFHKEWNEWSNKQVGAVKSG